MSYLIRVERHQLPNWEYRQQPYISDDRHGKLTNPLHSDRYWFYIQVDYDILDTPTFQVIRVIALEVLLICSKSNM